MRTRHGYICVAALGGLLTATLPAAAADLAARSFEIRGVVPVICNATYQPNVTNDGDGTIGLGSVAEFCNSGQGYRVVADYNSASDPGTLLMNGQSIALGAGGETVIAQVGGPAILSRQLSYRPGSTPITTLRIHLEAVAV
jgi:hypothetical protein